MTAKQRRRIAFVVALVLASAGAAALVLTALKDNVLYFYSPSDVETRHVQPGVAFRIGGLVAPRSVRHGADAGLSFIVTDGKSSIPVRYRGVLPALFREGQGVVALGSLDGTGTFAATEVLAKHDEKYMPPEVVDALKRSGRWKEGQ
jgi:cytochrome c-type biogenesis protein CcmE